MKTFKQFCEELKPKSLQKTLSKSAPKPTRTDSSADLRSALGGMSFTLPGAGSGTSGKIFGTPSGRTFAPGQGSSYGAAGTKLAT